MSTPEHPTGHDERDSARNAQGEGRDDAAYEQAMREHVETGMADGPDRVTDERDRTTGGAAAVAGSGVENRSDDFVTTSYDPDDAPTTGPPGTRMDRETDGLRGTDDTRGYDPTGDTGFVDERRAETDRTTGHRDADYDTGRVDTGPGSTGASRGPDRGTSDV